MSTQKTEQTQKEAPLQGERKGCAKKETLPFAEPGKMCRACLAEGGMDFSLRQDV